MIIDHDYAVQATFRALIARKIGSPVVLLHCHLAEASVLCSTLLSVFVFIVLAKVGRLYGDGRRGALISTAK